MLNLEILPDQEGGLLSYHLPNHGTAEDALE